MQNFIGKKVIIRADRAGVFYGTLAAKEGTEVELKDCRRLWYWSGAASISEIALSGVTNPQGCKFTVVVPQIIIMGVVEIIPCTDDAVKCIDAIPVWKMSR